jgi:DNA-binding PadR family transcriptional regulator
MTTQHDIQTNPPLTEATFFIMLSLATGPKHGYAIMKEVMDLSDRRVLLSTGTLYGALKRLLKDGWIERAADHASSEDIGRPRKAYTLTDLGRRILEAEASRLRALVEAARLVHPARERA